MFHLNYQIDTKLSPNYLFVREMPLGKTKTHSLFWITFILYMGQFPPTGKMVKMWHFKKFLELCCDQRV